MDSLTQAARIIDGTTDIAGVDALLSELGFADRALTLDHDSCTRLGLPAALLSARVSTSQGSLRALSAEVPASAAVRDCVGAIARQLSLRAPHLLWLVVLTQRDGPSLALATWRSVAPSPQITAIVIERGRVVNSDTETVCALAAAAQPNGDVMRHLRWLDILGRDAVTRRFFRALTEGIGALAGSLPSQVPPADAHEIALLTASRLLFLSFLETKGWLDSDFGFLANGFAECMSKSGDYQRRVLEPLFFGTLNTRVTARSAHARAFGRVPFLNGGLFSRTRVERIHRHSHFSDDALGGVFGDVLTRYRFTAREDTANWSQTAIDPEILGKVFESLMESGERKRDGVFYTPQRFVERVTLLTLAASLARHGVAPARAERLLQQENSCIDADPELLAHVAELRILDPACGSGAFLVFALERVAKLRIALGDTRALSDVRRAVLTRSIFGVDSSPTAVWLCELRLWLSAVIDSTQTDPMHLAPLPNLDRQIRIGDSLSGDAFVNSRSRSSTSRSISALRERYSRSSGQRKISLGRRLDLAERLRAREAIDTAIAAAQFERKEILRVVRSRDLFSSRTAANPVRRDRLIQLRSSLRELRRRRVSLSRGELPAFTYPTHFSDVADEGGFDAIIGNPPWVRAHNILSEARARYRECFTVVRSGAWAEGARAARAGSGFAGQVDLAALFVERATDLLTGNGTLGLLLPSKLWRSLAGGGLRQLILERTRIVVIEDHARAPNLFDAAVYPSILIASRSTDSSAKRTCAISVGIQRCHDLERCTIGRRGLTLDSTPGSPWLLLPPDQRGSFDLLASAGIPLFESVLARPHLGVKTGCNEAFVVNADHTTTGCHAGGTTRITSGPRHGDIETELLRPLVRGETLTQWRLTSNAERIIWTHRPSGEPIDVLPPHAHRWLARSRRQLERRSDSRNSRWWSLFRTESADCRSARVVWADFGRAPRAAVIDAGDSVVPLNTCYTVTCPLPLDALAFTALLNSRIAAAWLAVIAEPARGGYHRYLGWTIARLPIPIDWPRARRLLAPFAERACQGDVATDAELDQLVLEAYQLAPHAVDPLLGWVDDVRG